MNREAQPISFDSKVSPEMEGTLLKSERLASSAIREIKNMDELIRLSEARGVGGVLDSVTTFRL